MSLPLNELSNPAAPGGYLVPDVAGRVNRLIDYELGGIALGDATQGLAVQSWRLRWTANNFLLSAAPYASETSVLIVPNVIELSFAFDQNMQISIAYRTAAGAYLYWYDPLLGAVTTATLQVGIESVFLTMDDKREVASTFNDVLLFYILGASLYYRQQRERFTVERLLKVFDSDRSQITYCGMNNGNRMQLHVA